MGMQHTSQVHVIGGGLAGLTAAALVARAGHPVVVHESRGRLGGRATTDDVRGFRFNQGPHALYRNGPGERVLRSLGIEPVGTPPPLAGAMALLDGQIELLPSTPASMVRSRLLGSRDKVAFGRAMLRMGKLEPSTCAGTTVSDLVDDLTDRPAVRDLLHALIRLGTYTNLPRHLSAEVALLQMQLALADGVVYLHGGWERLVEELAVRAGARIETGSRLEELPDAAAVIVATGTPQSTGALLDHRFEVGPPAEGTVLDLGLDAPPPHDFVLGIDEPMYLSNHGCAVGVPAGRHSVSLARYLPYEAPGATQDHLRAFARRAGVASDRVVEERYLHRMTVVSAVASAEQGGLAGRPPVTVADRPGVFVAGDWVGPDGHLVDAVLASAAAAARAAIAHLDRRPVLR